jgi:7,8-dihydropterin-6-yl-methyl-4-(beta-D-ribofuranosyl)aminobenzene 5'-phosphate synthase
VCTDAATDDVHAAMPQPAVGGAADPIALEPVDDLVVTTLVDNVYDALLASEDTITRAPFTAGTAQAPQFEPGRTNVGLLAEHGFSALVTVRRGDTTTSVLFDTGLSPDAMVTNADRLGLDLSGVHAVVLSHGHFDHAGGLAGLAGRRGTRSLPMLVHPLVWTRRRLALPGGLVDDWPTLSKRALTGEGFDVIERRQPSSRTHRTGARPTGTRTLHRLASSAHARRRATRQLGSRQQRQPLPAHRLLTCPVATGTDERPAQSV